jgi:predicted nucleic acid-binding protein
MTKIYVDTNVFLDFYQSSHDRLAVFETIHSRSADILLTEQTVNEFKRNRTSRLSDLASNVDRAAKSISIYTTAVIRELDGFKEWDAAKDSAKTAAGKISKILTAWIEKPADDKVFSEFEKLCKNCALLKTTPDAIRNAHTRKLIGSPPTSPDKHTIGDELIWETLLMGVREDLVIVSRDKTFRDNHAILREEFEGVVKKQLVLVTDKLGEAFSALGKPEPVVEKAEQEIRDEEAKAMQTGRCPECEKELEETGYEGSDGDSAWWLYCPSCKKEFFPSH